MKAPLLSAVTLLTFPVVAQTTVWATTGSGVDTLQAGRWTRDLNGDGVGDVLVPVKPGGSAIPWRMWILSGATGKLLRVPADLPVGEFYLTVASAGDVTGDGVGDYAATIDRINAGNALNVVRILNGVDDTVLWQVEGPWGELFGKSLVGDLDVDADGRPDLVLATPTAPMTRTLRAYSNTGQLLWVSGGTASHNLGFRQFQLQLGKIGDLNGDGCDDVVAASSNSGLSGAAVVSGKDGRILIIGVGEPGDQLGEVNDGCGDMDGDGTLDFGSGQLSFAAIGGARVWSGGTGKPLWTWRYEPRQANQLGRCVSSKGFDADRDGVPDFGVGDPGALPSLVLLFSGRDGSQILRVTSLTLNPRGSGLGQFFELVPPVGGDPHPCLLSWDGGPYGPPTCSVAADCGRMALIRLAPPGVVVFGAACQGTLAKAPQIGLQGLASKTRIHLAHAEAEGLAALVLGFSRTSWAGISLPTPLPGFPGCQLMVSVDAVVIATTAGGRRAGYAGVELPLPLAKPEFSTVRLHGQWIAIGSALATPGGTSEGMLWYH